MKIMRKPQTNAAIIIIVSAFYAVVFILTSGHLEFERMLNHSNTLNSSFWNTWSIFMKQGNMKYVGYVYIILAMVIAILSLIRKRDYDEYQTGILEKGLLVAGIVIALLFPLALLLVLSDPNYSIEVLMFLVVVHWSAVLVADLLYVIKWGKS